MQNDRGHGLWYLHRGCWLAISIDSHEERRAPSVVSESKVCSVVDSTPSHPVVRFAEAQWTVGGMSVCVAHRCGFGCQENTLTSCCYAWNPRIRSIPSIISHASAHLSRLQECRLEQDFSGQSALLGGIALAVDSAASSIASGTRISQEPSIWPNMGILVEGARAQGRLHRR